jgi:hypothetical protein
MEAKDTEEEPWSPIINTLFIEELPKNLLGVIGHQPDNIVDWFRLYLHFIRRAH